MTGRYTDINRSRRR